MTRCILILLLCVSCGCASTGGTPGGGSWQQPFRDFNESFLNLLSLQGGRTGVSSQAREVEAHLGVR